MTPLAALVARPFAVDPARLAPEQAARFAALQGIIAARMALAERAAGHMGRLPAASQHKYQAAGRVGGSIAGPRRRVWWDAPRIDELRRLLAAHTPKSAIAERMGIGAKSLKVTICRLRERGAL